MEKRTIRYKGVIYDRDRPVRRATAADLQKFCDTAPQLPAPPKSATWPEVKFPAV